MKTLLSILLMAGATVIPAQGQNTRKLTAVKTNDYGIVYNLPVTVADITVEAEVTERQPGEFFRYAKKYLNVDNPVTEPSWTATVKSVTVNTRGEADPEQRYLVTLKSGNAPYIILDAEGVPLAINTEEVADTKTVPLPSARAAQPTPLETDAARQVVTEDMLRSHSTAKRAELAAEQIYALRQSRTDLITGQADQMPPDGQSMQLVLDNINAQEAALVAMFLGTEKTRTEVRTFAYTPQGDATNVVIARISPRQGIVAADDLSGAPVYLTVKVVSRGELPVNDKGEQLAFPKEGVAYCIPGTDRLTVSYDGRTYADVDIKVAQEGVVYGMAPSSFTDKKAPVCVQFDPATGAIIYTGPAK